MKDFACVTMHVTKPCISNGPKKEVRGGKVTNPSNLKKLDEVLFSWDVAVAVTTLFPDTGVFDDGDEADEILSTYFGLILVQEAKKLVMEAYAKNTN